MSAPDYAEGLAFLKERIPTLSSISRYETRLDDAFLLRFLKTAKNDPKKALKRYEEYYKVIAKMPKADTIISGRQENYQWLLDAIEKIDASAKSEGLMPMLTYYGRDAQERHIIGYDSSSVLKSFENENFLEATCYMTLILLDYLLESYDDCNDKGLVSIENQEALNFKMFQIFFKNPSFIKTFSKLMDGTLPIRFNKCYIANGPKLVSKFFNLIKPLLSRKMVDKCHITNDNQVIRDDLGGDQYLPTFLGGQNGHQNLFLDYHEQLRKVFPTVKGGNRDRVGDANDEASSSVS